MPITHPPNEYQSASPSTPHTNPSRQNQEDYIAQQKAKGMSSDSAIQSTARDERPTPGPSQLQARQEQMQPTTQMNVSESPRNEAKPGEQIERNQEKGEGQPAHTHNDWRYDLFSCWDDMGTCCMSCWCPCLIYGQNRQRLDHLEENDTPHPEHGGSGIGPDCIMHVALNTCCALGWVLQLGERGRLRLRYRIAGSPINDCLTAFFCTPCELTQESRELAEEEMAAPDADRQDVA